MDDYNNVIVRRFDINNIKVVKNNKTVIIALFLSLYIKLLYIIFIKFFYSVSDITDKILYNHYY